MANVRDLVVADMDLHFWVEASEDWPDLLRAVLIMIV